MDHMEVLKTWKAKRGTRKFELVSYVLDADYRELAGSRSYLLKETWKKGVYYPAQGLGMDRAKAFEQAANIAEHYGLVEAR